MASTISAGTTSGTALNMSADTTGNLAFSTQGGTNTLTVPNVTGTIMVNGPAFSAYQSSAQTLSAATATKLTFTTEEFDTNSNFASSRFTPTVEGYYQVNAAFGASTGAGQFFISIYKNGSAFKKGFNGPSVYNPVVSALINCNGSTDYIEIYGYSSVGDTLLAQQSVTYFQAAMVRSA